jgi:hypothetical protein
MIEMDSQATLAGASTHEEGVTLDRSPATGPAPAGTALDGTAPEGTRPLARGPRDVVQGDLSSSDLEPSDLEPSGLEPSGLEPSGLEPSGLEPSGLEPSHRRPRDTGARVPAGLLRRCWGALPPAVQVLAIYLASRWIDFLIISRVARFQAPSAWNPANPGYLDVVSLWDGDWYRRIAEHGFPATLPIDSYGNVAQNEWAFYPLYPFSVRALMNLSGATWPVAASIVSLVCGALAVVVLRGLIDRQAGPVVALWTVALFCFFPSAPVLQLAYTESMGMLLLLLSLWCLQQRQYLAAVPVVLLIGVARPIGAPVAAVIALHILFRILRRRQERVTGWTVAAMSALLVAAGVGAVEWMVIAARATGVPDAYTQTMAAWRAGHQVTLLRPWWTISQYWLGGSFGPGLLVVVVAVTVWVLTHPAARAISGDLRVWVVSYLGYLAVVLDPSTSLPRYLLLLFPFGTLAAATSPSSAFRRTLLLAFVGGQILWVAWLWRFSPPSDWPP